MTPAIHLGLTTRARTDAGDFLLQPAHPGIFRLAGVVVIDRWLAAGQFPHRRGHAAFELVIVVAVEQIVLAVILVVQNRLDLLKAIAEQVCVPPRPRRHRP